ncbi:DUF2645 family protein [Enterobacteriaceae bacterium 89]|nr:DUF2645 family protein [Enterobacteriaceae bacterium 89]
MSWKKFSLTTLWLIASVCWIMLWSIQDKEWWIRDGGIENICELMAYIENDDIREVGMILTLPVFFPVVYVILIKRKSDWLIYLVTALISAFWLWQFVARYQFCLW